MSFTSYQWKNVNIQGMGTVTGITISPNSPYDVYCKTDVGGAFRFDKANSRWVPLFDKYESSYFCTRTGIEAIAVDPINPKTPTKKIYVATAWRNGTSQADQYSKVLYTAGSEVLVSSDKGATWSPTGLAANNIFVSPNGEYRSGVGERLQVDPNNSNIIYFATRRNGVWKKEGANAWTQVTGGLPAASSLAEYLDGGGALNDNSPGFTFIAFDPSSLSNKKSQVIYVGAYGSGIYKSTDAGSTWTRILANATIKRGIVSNDGILFAHSSDKIFKHDPSVSTSVNEIYTYGSPFTGITVHKTNSQIVLAVDESRGFHRSFNGGSTWTRIQLDLGAFDPNYPSQPANASAPGYYQAYSGELGTCLVIDPGNVRTVWYANGFGVCRCSDYTVNSPVFNWVMNGLEELDSNLIRVPPKIGGAALISAVQDMIGFRHTDKDVVPTSKINPVGIPLNPSYNWANSVDWQNNGYVYPNPFPHVAGATGLDYCYVQPDYLYFVGFHQWQFWPIHGRSTDNGLTWTAFPTIPNETLSDGTEFKAIAGQIAVSCTNPLRAVWLPQNQWGWYTTDGGTTWSKCKLNNPGTVPSPLDNDNLDQRNWDGLPRGFSISINVYVNSPVLAADRADPAGLTFYYWSNFNFYKSVDGGATWTVGTPFQHENFQVYSTIVSNPTVYQDIFLTLGRNDEDASIQPLYRSSNGGMTFSVVSSVVGCQYLAFGKAATGSSFPTIYIYGRVGSATKDTFYKSIDNAVTWTQISDPNKVQFPGIAGIEGDMRENDLVYAWTRGRGLFYGKL